MAVPLGFALPLYLGCDVAFSAVYGEQLRRQIFFCSPFLCFTSRPENPSSCKPQLTPYRDPQTTVEAGTKTCGDRRDPNRHANGGNFHARGGNEAHRLRVRTSLADVSQEKTLAQRHAAIAPACAFAMHASSPSSVYPASTKYGSPWHVYTSTACAKASL